ncbi:MAG: SDR family NAD(P)-dependent oxidoreductase [Gammaproteobacteria bacterium]
MELRLKDKTAVVTGASTGIGREVALVLARHGAKVVVNYNASKESAEEVVKEIKQAGGVAKSIQGNVADSDGVDRLVASSTEYLGEIDVWANIAGADILTGSGSKLSDIEKLEKLISIDLKGTMMCSWRVSELMKKAGSGSIINISWDLALHGMEGRNPEMFAAVKGGITGFTKCLARSNAPDIRVNDVAPGWIKTSFADDVMREDYYNMVIESTPLRRFGLPEDVANAVLYLASDEAAFITGQTVKVNGGVV